LEDHLFNRRRNRTDFQRNCSAWQSFPHIPFPLREGDKGEGEIAICCA